MNLRHIELNQQGQSETSDAFAMLPLQVAAEHGRGLRNFLNVITRRRIWIVSTVLAGCMLAIAISVIMKPIYQANAIIASGKADLVFLARALLRDPYWALHAARELGEIDRMKPPIQYARAF